MASKNTLALVLTVAVGAVVLVSCSLFEGLGGGKGKDEGPKVFSHKDHMEDFSCTDCHLGAEKEAKAGMPTLETCLDCHDDVDKGSKLEKAILELKARASAEKVLWSRSGEVSELKFNHTAHVKGVTYTLASGQKKPLACMDCHGEVGKSDALPFSPPMDLCTDCHSKGKPAAKEGEEDTPGIVMNQCSVCHKKNRPDVAPVDHRGLWRVTHGEMLKFGLDEKEGKRCSFCHRKDFCTDCHNRDKPRSHTHFFRLRGHGIDARMNRDRCSTCHLQDFCIRCHKSTRPMSHSGSWAGPPYRHCTGCHLSGGMNRCTVCHKTTLHTLAPLYPRDANHTGNCTITCHTKQHPDPGEGCKTCHK